MVSNENAINVTHDFVSIHDFGKCGNAWKCTDLLQLKRLEIKLESNEKKKARLTSFSGTH